MPDVHLLTPGDLRQVTVACRATRPELGTWDPRAVTCAACLSPRPRAPAHLSSPSGGTEKAWLQQIRTLAQTHGWSTYHPLHSQGSEPGWPDLALLKGSVLRFAELKVTGGRVTHHQKQWLEGLQQVTQVHTHLWYPEDLPTIVEVLT